MNRKTAIGLASVGLAAAALAPLSAPASAGTPTGGWDILSERTKGDTCNLSQNWQVAVSEKNQTIKNVAGDVRNYDSYVVVSSPGAVNVDVLLTPNAGGTTERLGGTHGNPFQISVPAGVATRRDPNRSVFFDNASAGKDTPAGYTLRFHITGGSGACDAFITRTNTGA
jgi:hypothetical protein